MVLFSDYKPNFEKLENLVLLGGPDDGVITPWQSRCINFIEIHVLVFSLCFIIISSLSHFGFYDENLNVQPYQSQQVSIFPLVYIISNHTFIVLHE